MRHPAEGLPCLPSSLRLPRTQFGSGDEGCLVTAPEGRACLAPEGHGSLTVLLELRLLDLPLLPQIQRSGERQVGDR